MSDPTVGSEEDEEIARRVVKQHAILDIILACLEELHKIAPNLDLDEIAICLFVRRKQLDGEPCHIKIFPPFLKLSPVTINRKLTKLCEMGVLQRERRERVFYYTYPKDYFFKEDSPAKVYDDAERVMFKKIVASIAELMES